MASIIYHVHCTLYKLYIFAIKSLGEVYGKSDSITNYPHPTFFTLLFLNLGNGIKRNKKVDAFFFFQVLVNFEKIMTLHMGVYFFRNDKKGAKCTPPPSIVQKNTHALPN